MPLTAVAVGVVPLPSDFQKETGIAWAGPFVWGRAKAAKSPADVGSFFIHVSETVFVNGFPLASVIADRAGSSART